MSTIDANPATWVDRHGDMLYRMALLQVGNPETAAEVVQDTLLAALSARNSFEGRATERTWLVGILKHKIIDRRRKAGRSLEILESDRVEDLIESRFDRRKHWAKGPSSWPDEPSRSLESREFWDIFGACLSGLPRRLGEVFAMLELETRDRQGVCDDLKITPMNLATRLHRARLLLRECLEQRWFGASSEGPLHPNRNLLDMGRLRVILKVFTLNCEESAFLASESLDRRLTTGEDLAAGLHSLVCKDCRRYRKQLLFLRNAVNRFTDTDVVRQGPCLPEEVRERIRETLRREQVNDSAESVTP